MARFIVICLLCLTSFLTSLLSNSAISAERAEAKPSMFVVTTDPWADLIGGDSPNFALYDNGFVIYRAVKEPGAPFYSVKLNSDEKSQLMKLTEPLHDLKTRYQLVYATDQPTNILWYKDNGVEKVFNVYGRLQRDYPAGFGTKGDKLPDKLKKAFTDLSAYKHPKAVRWLPDYIEIVLWPFDYSKKKAIAWPANWPDVKDSRTEKKEDTYRLFVPKSEYAKLKEIMAQRGDDVPIGFQGKKWAMSYRFPFPGEKEIQEAKR